MNRIITIGREFGSGGRELGRRLAQQLSIAYYDKEILSEIANRTAFSEQYIQQVVEQPPAALFPITIGQTLYARMDPVLEQSQSIYQQQRSIIIEMAEKSDCVIVGRCADYILRDHNPFRIFVYAQMESKLARCKEKAPAEEHLTDKKLAQKIRTIDKNRAKYYEFYTGQVWGDKMNCDLCVNTTNTSIKELASVLAKLF